MKYLREFLKENRKTVVINLILAILQAVGIMMLPFLVAGIVDEGILEGDMARILQIGMWMVIITILTSGIAILGSWRDAGLAAKFGWKMREKLFKKSQQLALSQLDEVSLSSMVTRTTADIYTMQSTFGLVWQLVIPAPILAGVSIVMTVYTSPELAVVLLSGIVLLIPLSIWILKTTKPLSEVIQSKLDQINCLVRENVVGVRVIRAFGNEQHEEFRTGEACEDYAQTAIGLNRKLAAMNPVVWLLVGACMAAIIWVGGMLTGTGNIAIGQITAASEYTVLTLGYLIMAVATITTLPKMMACLNRLEEILDTEPNVIETPLTHSAHLPHLPHLPPSAPLVSFDNVTFSYTGAEEAVLRDISFICDAGETMAIIGGTGSGKSTIADLILHLHDIAGGNIRLEGLDIKDITSEELRGKLGYVPQKAYLFRGTIAENLRFGNENASDEQLWEALRVAQAESFVEALPLKLDSPVSQGGTNFSGGQKQRLCIARALVKSAEVYIFDDSFSALDGKTDKALREALESYAVMSAKIIIAQRISTIQNADRILVLDDGRAVDCGKHEELLKRCNVYRDIVNSQISALEE